MPIAIRVLYMLLFAVALWILIWILAVTVIAQLLLTVLGGERNAELLKFSKGISSYISQVIEFLCFLTDKPPFPFAPWPDRNPVQ
jgi:Domain of unknown function (DUF4389)